MVRGAARKEARYRGAHALSRRSAVRGGPGAAAYGTCIIGRGQVVSPSSSGASSMDDVERMYRHLVRTIRASFPQYESHPFEIGELYQTILPFRLHRRELGLETNQDYEHTLVELLANDRDYLIVDDRLRDMIAMERASSVPDTQRIRDFATTHVSLAADALRRLDGSSTPAPSVTVSRAAAAAMRSSVPPLPTTPSDPNRVIPPPDSRRRPVKSVMIREEGEDCPYCKGALPPGREISFCPHCGQDLTVVRCPACGSELERDWSFCVMCGRGVS